MQIVGNGYYEQRSTKDVHDMDMKEYVMADEKKTYTFRCTVCGYELTIDEPELPEDFVCPMCGVGRDEFELVED